MITNFRVENFKSWKDTGQVGLASISGFFGANSSGKTSLLQFLLALKQTVQSTDRAQVLNLGDERTLIDLGTFYDVVYQHNPELPLKFSFDWNLPTSIKIPEINKLLSKIAFNASLQHLTQSGQTGKLVVQDFDYSADPFHFGMERNASKGDYRLVTTSFNPKRQAGRVWEPPAPARFYGFPDEVYAYYQNVSFLSVFALQLEKLFDRIFYLGPLREYPHRSYKWSGEAVRDVGMRGEQAVPALLASRESNNLIHRGRGHRNQTVEECVVDWLKKMELINSYSLKPIGNNRKDYELRIQKTPQSPEVLITDVGFGISQILPVLVLCYYVPENSILIFEQPEIHLHPAVQYMLADVFIDAIKTRKVQIILESHSEHILQRFQRRAAEDPEIGKLMSFFFTQMKNGASELVKLALDEFGNITNWPEDFFGDEMGEMSARMRAEMQRKI